MAANENKELEEALNCPVCLEIFERPYILRCLHTICKACLDQLKKSTGSVTCPECRVNCQASDINQDFKTQKFIDIYNKKKNEAKDKAATSKATVEVMKNGCEICSKGEIHWGCLECVKLMCDGCKVAHAIIPACANHTIQSTDIIMQPFKAKLETLIPQLKHNIGLIEAKVKQLENHRNTAVSLENQAIESVNRKEKLANKQIKEYYNSMREKIRKAYTEHLKVTESKSLSAVKLVSTLESQESEIQNVLKVNDCKKIVYSTNAVFDQMSKGLSEIQDNEYNPMPLPILLIKEGTLSVKGVKVQNMTAQSPPSAGAISEVTHTKQKQKEKERPKDKLSVAVKRKRSPTNTPANENPVHIASPRETSNEEGAKDVVQSTGHQTQQMRSVAIELSAYGNVTLQMAKEVFSASMPELYFKLASVNNEIWCTLSCGIDIYNTDGTYLRKFNIEKTGNPYAVTQVSQNAVIVAGSNGIFHIDLDDEKHNPIAPDKFIDVTVISGAETGSLVICGLDIWKQRSVAYKKVEQNQWKVFGELKLHEDIGDLDIHDTITGNRKHICITSYRKGTIYKQQNSDGQLVGKYGDLSKPHICHMDKSGSLLITERGSDRLQIIHKDGRLQKVQLDKQLSIHCACFDDKGELWVLNKDQKLLKFTLPEIVIID